MSVVSAAVPPSSHTIEDLQRQMAAGEFTAQALTAAYLERIEAIDRNGPTLRAVIEVNPDALAIATKLEEERRAGKVRGPLHGIPILLKDNIATGDRMETTAGSLALVGLRPPADAPIVVRLRAAGAVILGKTNLSEWANFRGERSVSGWSGRGGQTRNPHALDRSPSGSSSGSAVAVAANLCVFAIGTETNGSIVSPASVCGIVGMKPTVGLVSRRGIIPIAASFDTAGPMTRNVRDAAVVLQALAAVDPDDTVTTRWPVDFSTSQLAALRPNALRRARIGLIAPEGYWPAQGEAFDRVRAVLAEAGAELEDVGQLPRLPNGLTTLVFRTEMKVGLNAYLATLGPRSPTQTLEDLIRFNEENRARELPLFGQQHFIEAQKTTGLNAPDYMKALETGHRLTRDEGIDALMDQYRLDALVAMTRSPADLIEANEREDPVFKRRPTGGSSTAAAIAGYPSLTLPAGEISGLPIGVTFFGRAWSESILLALAADFEARTRARRDPKFLPTIGAR